jgi:hypothetical protein
MAAGKRLVTNDGKTMNTIHKASVIRRGLGILAVTAFYSLTGGAADALLPPLEHWSYGYISGTGETVVPPA